MTNNRKRWYKEVGGIHQTSNGPIFKRKTYLTLSEIESYVLRLNKTDVYATPYQYNSSPQAESLMYSSFYLDFDAKIDSSKDYEKVKQDVLIAIGILEKDLHINARYIELYFSGNKGFHIVINPMALGITPKRDLNEDFKVLAKAIKVKTLNKTIDTVIYDKVRLFRIPNTINSKSGLYKVRVSENMLKRFSYGKMKLYASKPRVNPKQSCVYTHPKTVRAIENLTSSIKREQIVTERNNKENSTKKLKGIPPCVLYALDDDPIEGSRNNSTVAFASAMFQSGVDEIEIKDILVEWNNKSPKPISSFEVHSAVDSACRMVNNGRGYGCTSLNDLGYCIGELCLLYKREDH